MTTSAALQQAASTGPVSTALVSPALVPTVLVTVPVALLVALLVGLAAVLSLPTPVVVKHWHAPSWSRAAAAAALLQTTNETLRPGESLPQALVRAGASIDDAHALVQLLGTHLDVRALRAHAPFSVGFAQGPAPRALRRFAWHTRNDDGVPRTITATRSDDHEAFVIALHDAPVEVQTVGISGEIRRSLYDAIVGDLREGIPLVTRFVDMFAWSVDFYRQAQPGDRFRAVVEKRYVVQDDGTRRMIGYGRVLAARYDTGTAHHEAFAFVSADHTVQGIFDGDGRAMERSFLTAPLSITRVTSRFGMRFHPVVGGNRKHEGIDYGAPAGTPVWSVADGVVVKAGYSSTAGNMVLVRHRNGIDTEYFHLARFADGVAAGAPVQQKQLLGYVGNTGQSTGTHLHFGMLRGGTHVDPGSQRFPSATPLPSALMREFQAFVAPLRAQLAALARA